MTGPVLDFEWTLSPGDPAAVACSGGPDSFALLHALYVRGVPVVAFTVDHRLRPEAADEAAAVAGWCGARDIPHETLVWQEGPEGGVQAAARAARYRLLCQACNRHGIDTLVTGHTADDQAETVFMRLRRGSGRGLAAMPLKRLIAGGAGAPVTLYRPLLGVRRRDTQAYAAAHDLPVANDPSNEDETYERIRIRALLGALEQQDLLTVEALCRTAVEVRDAAEQPEPNKADASFLPDGSMRIRAGWHEETFVSWAVSAVGGGERRAYARSYGDIATAPHRLGTGPVGGAIVEIDTRHDVLVYREPAALLGRADGAGGVAAVPVRPGERHLFDRRFIIHVTAGLDPGQDIRLLPLGALVPRDIATSTLERRRISTLPCLAAGNRLTHLPEQCVDLVRQALHRWKTSQEFLTSVEPMRADSLLEERFSGRVIRF